MDLSEIQSGLAAVQAEAIESRNYTESLQAADAEVKELNGRLEQVKGYLRGLQAEFGGPHDGIVVKLREVEESSDEETGDIMLAGAVRVTILAFQVHEERHTRTGFVKTSGTDKLRLSGFELRFNFVPSKPDSAELDENHARLLGVETTFDTKGTPSQTSERWDPTIQTSELGFYSYSPKNAEELMAYTEGYLPENRQRVINLEQSVEMIKGALADPKLNPWVEERRAKEAAIEAKVKAEAEALAEEESGRVITVMPGVEEVRRSYPIAHGPGRAVIGGNKLFGRRHKH